jgi:hypothetical protein
MPYIRDSFWRGRTFTSVEHMQDEAIRWCREVAGTRSCRPLDGARPLAVFEAIEAERLRPLPAGAFVLAEWATAKVGPDIHARVGGVLYSIPWRHIGTSVHARSTATMVQFFVDGQLIKAHARKQRGKQTDLEDYPPEKIAFFQRTPAWCRRQAADIGPNCRQVIAELMADNALYHLRAAQGVVGLAEGNGAARLEAACGKALAAGDPTYRTIKGILVAGTETDQLARQAGDGGAQAHLHGPDQLFADVIPLPTATSRDETATATTSTGEAATGVASPVATGHDSSAGAPS